MRLNSMNAFISVRRSVLGDHVTQAAVLVGEPREKHADGGLAVHQLDHRRECAFGHDRVGIGETT
jgi:hypothetical protein